jgi:DNA-binding Lrp family transcriptional regulator
MEKFREARVIHSYPFVNIFTLGLAEYGFYLSLANRREDYVRLMKWLRSNRQVAWVLELSGEFNLGIALCSQDYTLVGSWLERFSELFGEAVLFKSMSIRKSWILFPRQYLSTRRLVKGHLACRPSQHLVELDDKDRAIIMALSDNPYSSIRELAQGLQLPLSTVQHRLRQMEESQVIMGYAYELNPETIGAMGYRLLLHTPANTHKLRQQLYAYCEKSKHIFALIECFGSWDFELKLEVESDQELQEEIGKLYEAFTEHVRDIKILRVISTPKLRFYPF